MLAVYAMPIVLSQFYCCVIDDSPHIEYVTISESDTGESVPISNASTALSDGNVFVEGPLDMPGATVEIVETDPQPVLTPRTRNQRKNHQYTENSCF